MPLRSFRTSSIVHFFLLAALRGSVSRGGTSKLLSLLLISDSESDQGFLFFPFLIGLNGNVVCFFVLVPRREIDINHLYIFFDSLFSVYHPSIFQIFTELCASIENTMMNRNGQSPSSRGVYSLVI